MPNQRGVSEHEWTEYATTVDAIEQASGYDFLNAIPERVQRVIEARTRRRWRWRRRRQESTRRHAPSSSP